MITVNITGEYNYASDHLDQYDYGQILRLCGELPSPVEVQFSLQKTGGEAPRRLGTEVDGAIEVEIPDEMLRNNDTTHNYQIYAFVYVRDETSGETTHRIVIPVKSRPKPGNYLPPEPKDYGEQLIASVMKERTKAEIAREESEAWAHGHENYPERDEDNARYYAEQAKKASEEAKKNIDQYVEEKKEELKGEPGAEGKSAYEYALAGGYTGTEEEFRKILSEDVPQINELNGNLSEKVTRPSTAEVGQVLAVKSVDKEGKPTEFEAKEMSGGGASKEEVKEAVGEYLKENPIEESDPTVPDWAKQTTKPTYTKSEVGLGNVDNVKQYSASNPPPYPVGSVNGKTGAVNLSASDVGADASGTAESKVSGHNTSEESHSDIRLLIEGLTTRLNALADSDDTTLDQMSEVVTYIKSNKSLIESITTSKVDVKDIIDNLTTNVSNKPLSAAQGVALKTLIDAILVPTKVSELQNDSGFLTSFTETDPTVPAWAKKANKPTYTASEVGADTSGTAKSAISVHNTANDSHSDIRMLIAGLTTRLNALADSDDTTLDQMSEVVAYIKSNKSLIDAITISKVSVSDIVNDLVTNVADKPLSAAQGVALKSLIGTLSSSLSGYQPKGDYALRSDIPTKLSALANDTGYLTEHQDISGKMDKVDGRGLSTNDYDNAAKQKVDAIPENPKYTDTVTPVDATLKNEGEAADAKATGEALSKLSGDIANSKARKNIDKNVNFVGMSIWWYDGKILSTSGFGGGAICRGYQTLLKECFNFKSTANYCYSGFSLGATSDTDTSSIMNTKAQSWIGTYGDIWTLDTITNDFKRNIQIGTINDYINATGVTTYYGALRAFTDKVKELSGERATVICSNALRRNNGGYTSISENTQGHTLLDYEYALINVAVRNNWYFVDQYRFSGITDETIMLTTLDGLHLNNFGFTMAVKPWIEQFNIVQSNIVDEYKNVITGTTTSGYINTSGEFVHASSWVRTDYIEVVEGRDYLYFGLTTSNTVTVCLIYGYNDENEAVMPILFTTKSSTIVDSTENGLIFSIPDGVKKIACCSVSSNSFAIKQVSEYGWIDMGYPVAKYYLDTTGGLKQAANWRTSTLIVVNAGETYRYYGNTSANNSIPCVCGYDSTGAFVSVLLSSGDYTSGHEFTVPSGVTYIRYCSVGAAETMGIYKNVQTIAN